MDSDSCRKPSEMHSADKFCTDYPEQLLLMHAQGHSSTSSKRHADLDETVTAKVKIKVPL
ncbi:MAG: hypothetical protein ACUVUE_01470 [Candidatus Bathycorpusculaceae bacterium]